MEHPTITRYRACDTLEKFNGLLCHHDWFWYMSDQNLSPLPSEILLQLAKDHDDDWKRAYNRAHAVAFNNDSFVWKDHPYIPVFDGLGAVPVKVKGASAGSAISAIESLLRELDAIAL